MLWLGHRMWLPSKQKRTLSCHQTKAAYYCKISWVPKLLRLLAGSSSMCWNTLRWPSCLGVPGQAALWPPCLSLWLDSSRSKKPHLAVTSISQWPPHQLNTWHPCRKRWWWGLAVGRPGTTHITKQPICHDSPWAEEGWQDPWPPHPEVKVVPRGQDSTWWPGFSCQFRKNASKAATESGETSNPAGNG